MSGLIACTVAPAANDPDRAALDAAIQRWTTALNAEDVATLTATMTRDVEFFDEATTVKGADALLQALKEVKQGKLLATTREITIVDDVAWRVVALTLNRKDGVSLARGQSLEIWKRVNGEWRLHRRLTAGSAPENEPTRSPTKEPVLDRPTN